MSRRRRRVVGVPVWAVAATLLLSVMWLGTELARLVVTASTACGAL